MTHQYHRTFDQGLSEKYARVAQALPHHCSVLEVGCHTGYFSLALQSSGRRVLGLEYDAAAAEQARRQGVPVITGDIEDPALLAGISDRFDFVLFMDVLEHLRHPVDTLRRTATLLAPGGRVLITGPNVAYWAMRKNLALGRWDYQDAGIMDRTHLRFFTARTWQALLTDAGYQVERFEAAEGMLPLESLLRAGHLPAGLIQTLRNAAVRLAPTLFTTVFFIQAMPRRSEPAACQPHSLSPSP